MTPEMGVLWTMAGVFVSALGVLITLGAIFGAWWIFKQTRDAKALQDELIAKVEGRFDELFHGFGTQLNAIRSRVDEEIAGATEQLQSEAGALSQAKREHLEALERIRDDLELTQLRVRKGSVPHKSGWRWPTDTGRQKVSRIIEVDGETILVEPGPTLTGGEHDGALVGVYFYRSGDIPRIYPINPAEFDGRIIRVSDLVSWGPDTLAEFYRRSVPVAAWGRQPPEPGTGPSVRAG